MVTKRNTILQKVTCFMSLLTLSAICFNLSPTPVLAEANDPETYTTYYGQLHNHSYLSDGTGTPEEAYTYAKNIAKLDFFALADHSQWLTDEEWNQSKQAANNANQDGDFVTFQGFEWSGDYGHVTVLNTDDCCVAYNDPDTKTNAPLIWNFDELLKWIASRDTIAFFNHPGIYDSKRQTYAFPVTEKFVGMELWNKNAPFTTYYYNDGYNKNDGGLSYYDEANSAGWKIGASGSGDNHSATWGTDTDYRLAVLATAKTRAAIYDALKNRRFFSTLDKNLKLSFEIDQKPMGSVVSSGLRQFIIKASDADGEVFTKIELYQNGTLKATWEPGTNANPALDPRNPVITTSYNTVGNTYYYVKVTQQDGGEAISSPIFIQKATFDHFAIAGLGSQKVDQPFALTVTAFDTNNQVMTDFNQTVDLKLIDQLYGLEYNACNTPRITFVNGVYSGAVKVTYSQKYCFRIQDETGKVYNSNYFTVAGSDLVINSLTFYPSQPYAGVAAPMVITVRNDGPGIIWPESRLKFSIYEVTDGAKQLITSESFTLSKTKYWLKGEVLSFHISQPWIPMGDGLQQIMASVELDTYENLDWSDNNTYSTQVTVHWK